mgnify:FL=1
MFLSNMLSGIANFFAKSVSTACWMYFFDEPQVDKDLL